MNSLQRLTHGVSCLLLVACSGHPQDISPGASTPHQQQGTLGEIASRSLTEEPRGLLFDVAPEVQEKCTPFLVPKQPFRVTSDHELEHELRGLATCLQTAPLRNRGLELALQTLDNAEQDADTMKRLETVLIQLGMAAGKLTLVGSEPAYVAEPRMVLRLAKPNPSLG